ncbi:MFS-type transporter SLC18B1-like [Macrobrachium nipponense]|uniref:MFS-type transporter SLC18B1-like n=1 Tax=Macrobrachium nipponense TaxID=159736 RepID=UPI0030C84624
MPSYTRQQYLTLIVFAVADFCNAVCVSLQAPFYPMMAESKGASATQYGFVFGVFELVVFIASPIYGNYINQIGPKFMFNAGIFTTATTCILFGFLDRITDTDIFIGFSFAIRIIEAMGNAGFLTASFSIIAKEFPENVGATFASLETCYGLGMIAGPTVGGALFEVGGYTLPFVSLGGTLIAAATLTYCILPSHSDFGGEKESSGNILQLVKVPSIALAAYAIIASSISIGFLQATLEPHLRSFELSPLQLGFMFILNGATYGIFAPLWGWLCDKHINPTIVVIFGAFVIVTSFLMVGPAPFLPIGPITIPVCIVALILHGIGFGAELVATFTSAHRDAVANGFPDDIQTYGMVSGMWASTFALGAFIGPSAAGALFDHIGFEWATQFVVGLHVLVAVAFITNLCCSKKTTHEGLYTKIHNSLAATDAEKACLITTSGPKPRISPQVSIADSSYNSGVSDSSHEYYVS